MERLSDRLARRPVAKHARERLGIADWRDVVRDLQVGKFDEPYPSVPTAQQREQHRELALRTRPDRDDERKCREARGKPSVQPIEPYRMLERCGRGAIEEPRIFTRKEIE